MPNVEGPDLTDGWRVPAGSRFEASLEHRKVSRLKSLGSLAADAALSVGVGSAEAPLDGGRDRYRVVVTDGETNRVVRLLDFKGDLPAAKESLAEIEADLERLTIEEFAMEYGIE